MSDLDKLYKLADRFRDGTCPARLGERWCVHPEGHSSFYHLTDNGIAWILGDDGRIYDVHSAHGETARLTPSEPG